MHAGMDLNTLVAPPPKLPLSKGEDLRASTRRIALIAACATTPTGRTQLRLVSEG